MRCGTHIPHNAGMYGDERDPRRPARSRFEPAASLARCCARRRLLEACGHIEERRAAKAASRRSLSPPPRRRRRPTRRLRRRMLLLLLLPRLLPLLPARCCRCCRCWSTRRTGRAHLRARPAERRAVIKPARAIAWQPSVLAERIVLAVDGAPGSLATHDEQLRRVGMQWVCA